MWATTLANAFIENLRLGAYRLVRTFTPTSEFIEPLNLGANWLAWTLAVTGIIVKVLLSRTLDHLGASASAYRCVKHLLSVRTVLDKVGTLTLAFIFIKSLLWWTLHNFWASALADSFVKYLSSMRAVLGCICTFTLTTGFVKDLCLCAFRSRVRAFTLAGVVVELLVAWTLYSSIGTPTFAEVFIKDLSSIRAILGCMWTFTLAAGCVEDLRLCAVRSRVRAFTLAGVVVELLVAWTLYSSIGTPTFAEVFIKDLW